MFVLREELIQWFLRLRLSDYDMTFHESSGQAWLNHVDRRYAWFKRALLSYDEECQDIFPEDWGISERLAMDFCAMTRWVCVCVYVCVSIYVCMYVYMYVCMYVYMYVCMYICMCVCIYVCVYVCMYVCVYVCMYVYMYVCMYICMCVCMCVCVYVCIYVCVYVYMYVCMYICMCACVCPSLQKRLVCQVMYDISLSSSPLVTGRISLSRCPLVLLNWT